MVFFFHVRFWCPRRVHHVTMEVNRVYFCVDDPHALRREIESKREAVLLDGDRGEV